MPAVSKQHTVYARCWTGHTTVLRGQFTGTRYQCAKYISTRVRNNLPTHFLLTSTLDIEAASRRYLP